ncbi:hypothetical protein [Streptomyces sp. SP2-10]|uniref:hypothetical protein n=1 Tax=Streptomyces sp. SP2-10 TaxID=2873385 RepID=UPI001CA7AD55|nr:hypothetical protein [Streptomyces sp. SP2-10]MBY8844639.1 hypothetical protein [Streptomyces sp. SP2-10]
MAWCRWDGTARDGGWRRTLLGQARLDALRFARRVVEQHTARQLDLIDRWIADEERRQAERQRGDQPNPAAAPAP